MNKGQKSYDYKKTAKKAHITQVSFHLQVLKSFLHKCNKSTRWNQIAINGTFVDGSFIS